MSTPRAVGRWLDTLGYSQARRGLHVDVSAVDLGHRYQNELNELLRPDGQVAAQAVFEVDGVPAVAFFDRDLLLAPSDLDRVRQKIWNQNLISLVILVDDSTATVYPPTKTVKVGQSITIDEAATTGQFSLAEVASSEVQRRLPKWFSPTDRVDKQLLRNLGLAVDQLVKTGLAQSAAQGLLGQVLFISYLEHRRIVSDVYRQKRGVETLHGLIAEYDVKGVEALIDCLRRDFNGDFLALDDTQSDWWSKVSHGGLDTLSSFLGRVDLDSGQQSLWNYDFSFIPVELLSGIYESFIGERQSTLSAYYTPRHLANFVIDEAFHGSEDAERETIFDPACGSGILLTTAYRRLLHLREGKTQVRLDLTSRIDLLREHIFGADISEAACRVTAFSLYLSLLEDLQPSDIALLQENEGVKLPALRGRNLLCGDVEGDFFSPKNYFASSRRFSLVISNPPWSEPAEGDWSTADAWAQQAKTPRARRQLAGDFAFRALESVAPAGRICLIMPISLLVASTSRPFIQGWLARAHLERFVNFGDLHNFIFETAEHSCGVITSRPRAWTNTWSLPAQEVIEYWAPKVDASLAFGRLALTSADRHIVPTQAYFSDPTRMVTLMWGNEFDLALCTRLQGLGQVKDMFTRGKTPWRSRKGVHLADKHARQKSDTTRLKTIEHVRVDALKGSLPVLSSERLSVFPEEIESVVNLTDDLWNAFHGPRILFTDGFDSSREIRASYVEQPASFTSSVGVIAGPPADRDLLRFMAVFLRSSLASYFLLMRAFQVTCDRNRVTLTDIEKFPFVEPSAHPQPVNAQRIVAQVSELLGSLETVEVLKSEGEYEPVRQKIDRLIHEYFGLSPEESALVREANEILVPSVRPRGYKSINTAMHSPVDSDSLDAYVSVLGTELEAWRLHLGGRGEFAVQTWTATSAVGHVVVAAVTLTLETNTRFDKAKLERWTSEVMRGLSSQGLFPAERSESVVFLPDVAIHTPGAFLFVRPPLRRMWLRRSALRDARSIVERIQLEQASAQEELIQ
jgi:hypothetical protein